MPSLGSQHQRLSVTAVQILAGKAALHAHMIVVRIQILMGIDLRLFSVPHMQFFSMWQRASSKHTD